MVVATEQWGEWHSQYEYCSVKDSISQSIIKEYEFQTGVAARSAEDLVEAFGIKNDVSKQIQFDLDNALGEIKKLERRRNFWRGTAKIGIPVALVGGFVTGLIITTRLQ